MLRASLRPVLALPVLTMLLATSITPAAAGRIELLGENDTAGLVPGPAAHDRGYTQGARITWTGRPGLGPEWAERAANRIPGFGPVTSDGLARSRSFGVAVGQEIYTPHAISRVQAIPNDRPYAGWLYCSAFVVAETPRRQSTLEIQAGTTGPNSLAANVQTWWHRRLAIRLPRGWAHQLRNEPGLMIRGEERWRLFGPRRHADVIPHLGASVGNVRTEVWAGATARVGAPVPADFGPSKLGSSSERQTFHLYLFARAQGRVVARDLFLDGNTFAPSPRVTRIPLVAETQVGAGIRWHRLGVRYLFSYTTPEFRERPESHEYGSIGISF